MVNAPASVVNATVTPFVMGEHAASLLYGMLCLCTAQYAVKWRRDRAWYKWLVGLLWVLGTLQEIVSLAYTFKMGILERNSPNPEFAVLVWWGTWFTEVSKPLMLIPTQGFFAHRCYVVTQRNLWIGIGLGVFIFANVVVGLLGPYFYETDIVERQEFNSLAFEIVSFAWPWGSVVGDVMMSAILFYKLKPERKRWLNAETDELLRNVITLSISTAAVTTVVALVLAITEVVLGLVLTNIAIVHVVLMLQLIMPIAHLNLRDHIRPGATDGSTPSRQRMYSNGQGFITIKSGQPSAGGLQSMDSMTSLPPKRPLRPVISTDPSQWPSPNGGRTALPRARTSPTSYHSATPFGSPNGRRDTPWSMKEGAIAVYEHV